MNDYHYIYIIYVYIYIYIYIYGAEGAPPTPKAEEAPPHTGRGGASDSFRAPPFALD